MENSIPNGTKVRVRYNGENECEALVVGVASYNIDPYLGTQYIFYKADGSNIAEGYPYPTFLGFECWIEDTLREFNIEE